MIVASSEVISACRKSYGRTISATTAIAPAIPAVRKSRSVRGASGSRRSTSSPRFGRLVPRRNSATTIRPNTSSGCTPGIATPWSVGNQLNVWR